MIDTERLTEDVIEISTDFERELSNIRDNYSEHLEALTNLIGRDFSDSITLQLESVYDELVSEYKSKIENVYQELLSKIKGIDIYDYTT